jgi:hypothetical protein
VRARLDARGGVGEVGSVGAIKDRLPRRLAAASSIALLAALTLLSTAAAAPARRPGEAVTCQNAAGLPDPTLTGAIRVRRRVQWTDENGHAHPLVHSSPAGAGSPWHHHGSHRVG